MTHGSKGAATLISTDAGGAADPGSIHDIAALTTGYGLERRQNANPRVQRESPRSSLADWRRERSGMR